MKFQDLSIKRKLILMTMLTSSIALLLSSASFLIYDLISFRNLLTHDLTTQAQIIGYNSAAAMAFKDEPAATATLSALTAKGDIVSAALYSPNGQIFAHYFRDKETLPIAVPTCSADKPYRFVGQYLEVCHEVTLNGDRVGTLFLQSDMRQWSMRARRYATICLVFALVSVFLAFLVSSKLQKVISGPIMHLEDTMKIVSANKNYEVRAVKSYSDEIGSLIDGFNAMLSDIQHRDGALRGANDELQTRTLELEEEVSQRKQAQEELLKAKHVAEEASRAKSTFLANMSHELRTPLNAIIGYSEMLEEEARDTSDTDHIGDLQKIQFAGKHLLSLINDVLDLSKIEAGKMPLHLETFDVRLMVGEIITTLQPAIEKNKNTLRVRMVDEISTMRADLTKVRQILFNLLSNACKFTDHGIIRLDVDRKMENGQDWVRFQVSDTGIGIAPKQRENLFKEFAQADTSIARKYGGTGLGLAISYKFVQLMKGRIEVESELGQGATFTAELPAQVRIETADPVRSDDSSDLPLGAPTKSDQDTILVVDDDAAVRDLMTRFLSKLDLNVVAARNGEEGLRLAKQLLPMMITLDVVMPGQDGWSILNQLKSDPQLSEIPVIMVTIVDNEAMGINLGASGYLVKPVQRERLAELIEKYRTRASGTKTVKIPVSLPPIRKTHEKTENNNPRRR
ncbi:MAG TPA: ATP-binding protein [Terriglobales bacterium]|jgi:signal transduction histidine kinase/CheY-like chemotaxis protein|nr:ATP-binding protein [Terriglobales bacterium]